MNKSLKELLHEAIKAKYPDYLPLSEVERICKDNNRKISNGERRLRKSESPNILPIRNNKSAIIGYKYIQSDMVKVPITGTVNSRTGVINFNKEKTKSKIEQLNNQLNELEKKYGGANAWKNAVIIKNIREAIKSTSEYLKISTIKLYS